MQVRAAQQAGGPCAWKRHHASAPLKVNGSVVDGGQTGHKTLIVYPDAS